MDGISKAVQPGLNHGTDRFGDFILQQRGQRTERLPGHDNRFRPEYVAVISCAALIDEAVDIIDTIIQFASLLPLKGIGKMLIRMENESDPISIIASLDILF